MCAAGCGQRDFIYRLDCYFNSKLVFWTSALCFTNEVNSSQNVRYNKTDDSWEQSSVTLPFEIDRHSAMFVENLC